MVEESPPIAVERPATQVAWSHSVALAALSGVLLAYVLERVGWSFNAFPPLLLLIGLIQLAYCDLKRRLLPKTLVYALSVAVIASGVAIALSSSETERLVQASLGGVISFGLFFIVNLMNPRWMAFGDVRLSLVFGFGLAWVSPIDLFEAFLYANLLALVTGVVLIASRRADRKSALPFGLFMALGAVLVLVT
jgi:leader peptidase (prepilin peptidase) / N-methyltransferase